MSIPAQQFLKACGVHFSILKHPNRIWCGNCKTFDEREEEEASFIMTGLLRPLFNIATLLTKIKVYLQLRYCLADNYVIIYQFFHININYDVSG